MVTLNPPKVINSCKSFFKGVLVAEIAFSRFKMSHTGLVGKIPKKSALINASKTSSNQRPVPYKPCVQNMNLSITNLNYYF
jgi:hypothetical protein